MTECNPAETPIHPKLKLTPSFKNEEINVPFCSLIDALMYLAVSTRPDISFAVNTSIIIR